MRTFTVRPKSITATKTFEYNGYSIYDTGSGYKIYKDGQLASNIEYESVDDAIDSIDEDDDSDVEEETEEVVEEQPERNWLEEFSNYTKHMNSRVYPDGDHTDGVYAEGDKLLRSFLNNFKKKNPDCNLELSSIFRDGQYLYVVR